MDRIQMVLAAHVTEAAGAAAVAQVMQASRARVEGHAVSGAVLYDGERLFQLIDGPHALVHLLAQQWGRHPGMAQARSLAMVAPGGLWPVRGWRSGFVEAALMDAVLAANDPAACVRAFEQAMLQADLL